MDLTPYRKRTGDKLRIVVTGKGGVGKTTLTALLAHCFAGEGLSVLAIDGDPQQNLAATLGIPLPVTKRIIPLSERKEYIAEKIGTVPGKGGFMVLNPGVTDVIGRYGVEAGERIRLLVLGGVRNAGTGCLCPEYTLLSALLRNAADMPEDIVLLDTPAGLEHFGRSIAEGFNVALVVSDSSYNAMAVARDLARLAKQCGISRVMLVMNRSGPAERKKITVGTGDEPFPEIFHIPGDPSVLVHEPSVVPVMKEGSPVVRAAKGLMAGILKE